MDKGTSISQKTGLILFGVFLSLVILEIGLRTAGNIYLSVQHSHEAAITLRSNEYRIMCVGESTTALGGEMSYPFQLQDALNQKSRKMKFVVINTGMSGKTTEDLLIDFEGNINKFKPQMVIVMMGINDHKDLNPLEKGGKVRHFENSWCDSFKVCKLFRALWLNTASKIWDMGLAESRQDKVRPPMPLKPAKNKALDKMYVSYCDSAKKYEGEDNFSKAQEFYQKAIALDPNLSRAYIQSGELYGKGALESPDSLDKAEAMFFKAIQIDPKDIKAYLDSGMLYHSSDPRSLEMFKKALEIDPTDQLAYTREVEYYVVQKNYPAAEKTIAEAIDKNIGDLPVQFWRFVVTIAERNKDYVKEELALRKIIEMQGAYNADFCNLAEFYQKHGDENRAKEIYEEAIKLNGGSRRVYKQLAEIYKKQGNNIFADICLKKSQMFGDLYQNPMTISNYRRLVAIARQYGIKVVCMSYATRSVGPLKKNLGDPKDVFFIDNEMPFKEAVKNEGYNAIFVDKFAGDFGHGTARGNQLLVEDILNVFMKDGSFNSLLGN